MVETNKFKSTSVSNNPGTFIIASSKNKFNWYDDTLINVQLLWSGESAIASDVTDTCPVDIEQVPLPLPTPARAYPKSFENADERRKNFLRVNTSHLKIADDKGKGGKGDGEETPSTTTPASTGQEESSCPTPEVVQPPPGQSASPTKVEAEVKAISEVEAIEAKVLKFFENGNPT